MITFLGNDRSHSLYKDLIWEYRNDKDLIVSCQYPYKIPASLVCGGVQIVNIHYGLLPYFRGMNPIYWQMMKSDMAGVTLHYVDKNFDSGDIIDSHSFPHYGMTANEVYAACEKAGKKLLEDNIENILYGCAERERQESCLANYYKKEDVDFTKDNRVGVIMTDEDKKRVFATHFEGKQYPVTTINGRKFELRAV